MLDFGQLTKAVMRIESAGKTSAKRFEPHVYARQKKQFPNIDEPELVFRSSSHGAFQIMGYNLRNMGYTGTPARFYGDFPLQLQYFKKFVQQNITSKIPLNRLDLDSFGAIYNAGNNSQAARIRAANYRIKLKSAYFGGKVPSIIPLLVISGITSYFLLKKKK